MASPVIFDDGGSTRIKQLVPTGAVPAGVGRLDDLLEVVAPAGGSAQSEADAPGDFSKISVTCLNDAGAPTSLLDGAGNPVPAGTFPIPLAPGHTFEIFSGKHRTRGKLLSNPGGTGVVGCRITLVGTGGVEPNVEARNTRKQNKQQRRYVISNAPSIDRVEVNAAGPARSFKVPDDTLYTTVILS